MSNPTPLLLTQAEARRIWLHAQRLDTMAPFGDGPEAVSRAVDHLGYVQIDTINVIERCHHHILWTRIPGYSRQHLHQAHSVDKTVFEYWTHALSYIPTKDFRFFLPAMKQYRRAPTPWFDVGHAAGPAPGHLHDPHRTARSRSATSTTRCWWKRSMPGPAASRPNEPCNWHSTSAR